ncbi:hypothetical protein CGC20_18170 [Leishmania donovani]|uniref:Uncharacterized protein n=1 Tax=Leishmania donovani TaxID=5661 RepID=A0A504XQQ1_LEIDO|nr:hypothetical protein CGC20_18170 [Leishmania donovani]
MQPQSTQHWGATDTIRVAQDEPSASRGRAAADGLVSSFRIPSSRVRCTPPSKRPKEEVGQLQARDRGDPALCLCTMLLPLNRFKPRHSTRRCGHSLRWSLGGPMLCVGMFSPCSQHRCLISPHGRTQNTVPAVHGSACAPCSHSQAIGPISGRRGYLEGPPVERFANLAWHTGHNAGPDALIASTGGDRGSGEGGGTTVLAEQQAAHHLHSVVSPSATRRCMNAKYGPVSSRNCAKHQRA